MAVEMTPGARCPRHAMILASRVCDACGKSVCERCVLPQSDGTIRCLCCSAPSQETYPPPAPSSFVAPSGGATRSPPAFTPSAPYAQFKCGNHPENEAIARCSGCGAHVCGVCDFRVSGRHACPACVMKEPDAIPSKRRNLAIVGYLLAAWATLGMGLLLSGYFASMVQTEGDLQQLDLALRFLVFLPNLAGFACSMTAIERNQPNSTFLWVPVVWNALLVAGYTALTILGTFS